jgi:hypothetical protein
VKVLVPVTVIVLLPVRAVSFWGAGDVVGEIVKPLPLENPCALDVVTCTVSLLLGELAAPQVLADVITHPLIERVSPLLCLVPLVCGLDWEPLLAVDGEMLKLAARSTQMDVMTVFLPEPVLALPVTVVDTPEEFLYVTLHDVPVPMTVRFART